jgi:hypothetical protein
MRTSDSVKLKTVFNWHGQLTSERRHPQRRPPLLAEAACAAQLEEERPVLVVLAAAVALVAMGVTGPALAKKPDGSKLKVRPFVCKAE